MPHWARVILEDAVWEKRGVPHHVMEGLNRLVEFMEGSDVYQFRVHELGAIADDISVCEDLAELCELMWQATVSAGFQNFSIFLLNQGQAPAFASRMCTSYNQNWLEQYEAKAYQFVDPVLAKARNCIGSFTFAQTDQSSPVVKEFLRDAECHSIGRNGLCYVTVRPNGARLGVSFSTANGEEKTDELVRLNGSDLYAIAQLATECFSFIASGNIPSADTLSIEELRFLHILSTSPNPEQAFALSPQFGGNKSLQASIRKKLNTTSIFQAISMASAMQWFDNLPICPSEVVRSSPALSGWELAGEGNSVGVRGANSLSN